MHIATLITCFNRVDTTIRNLRQLHLALDSVLDLQHETFLVDDASPDGTGERVAAEFPRVHVLRGNGGLYWAGGMRLAFLASRREGPFDAYLLFNDDVSVHPKHAQKFFDAFKELNRERETILVGATTADDGVTVTYSGFREVSRWRARSFAHVQATSTFASCDAFNGNFALVPSAFFEGVGGIDKRFSHAYGDIALGLTARRLGVRQLVYPTPVGVCSKNNNFVTQRGATIRSRLALVRHPRFSFKDFEVFVRRYRPLVLYPLYVGNFVIKRAKYLLVGGKAQ